MSLSRRRTLSLLGGGIVVAAAGSAGAFLSTRTPTRALAPWDEAGSHADARLHALSWAILAPNPHNRQPWAARLVGEDTVLVFRDPGRNLPHTDPHDRQLTIGMGCFLELLVMAAAQRGHGVDLEPFPEGDAGPVAVARFRAGSAAPDPLFAHAAERRSCKEPFEDRPPSSSDAAALAAYAQVVTGRDQVDALRALTWEAWMIEATTPRTMKESVDLMRFGRAEIEASPDGIDLGGPMLESLMLLGQLSRAGQMDPQSSGFRQGMEIYREMLAATPAYAVVTSGSNSRLDQVDAGRRWLRLNLATTARGMALHPVSQCLQEFPEMAGPYARAHGLLAPPGHTVQMLGRLGYGPSVPRTPRWPLQSRLLNA
jgi:hypothetical protein